MTIRGLTNLQRKLAALPDAARESIAKAMEASANRIVNQAQGLVPIGDSMQLYDSIGWTWGDAPKGSMTLGTVRGRSGRAGLRITIYAGDDKAYYARWVEFGTAPHNAARGGGTVSGRKAAGGVGHPGSSAQPFFYVSYRAQRSAAKRRINSAITSSAKRVARASESLSTKKPKKGG